MSLSILSVAYPFAPVGPDAVGGAEQVLSHLDRALTHSGHTSLVIAQEGSVTRGQLVPIPKVPGILTPAARAATLETVRTKIEQTLSHCAIDLVHMHGVDFYEYLPPAGVPVLVTLHLPPAWYPKTVFDLERRDTYLQCVSAAQRRSCPPSRSLGPVIENGVPVQSLGRRCHAKRRFALALGRICAEKGFHLALDAAARAQVPMLLGGAVFPYAAHQQYFTEQIVPRLSQGRRFLGAVGFRRKRRLLSAARCLIVPSLVAETSSLVAMEALACGTPVIAFPSGALADIIEHGRTGWLVRDQSEMAEVLRDTHTLSSDCCREAARNRFNLERMVAGYFGLYGELIQRPVNTASAPTNSLRSAFSPALSPENSESLRLSVGSSARLRFPQQPTGVPILAKGGFAFERITSLDGLRRLEPEWIELWRRCSSATPFQSPAWLVPWWRCFGSGELRTMAIRRDGRLVGLWPCYVPPSSAAVGPPRVALLLGTGITDYLDVLLETQTGEAGELLRSALARTAGEWDLCDFQSLPSNSPLLASTVRGKARVDVRQQDVCPVLSLPARAEELPGPISRHQWENYRYYRRRAERRAHLQVQTANEETVGDCLDVLLQLHRARWTERGCPGVLADVRVESFHKEAAAGLQALGVLRLYVLRLNGRPAAALYACLWKRRFYYYVGGFGPSFRQVSPGTLLIGHAVQEAVREGADIFDFLRGQESYKYLWNARDTFTYRLQIRPTA